ncbi:MAG: thioredoxin family protein [bacterium]
MKAVLVTLALMISISLVACSTSESSESMPTAESGINWLTDVNQARTTAASENKPIFAYFTGSDWCGWCKRLDANVLSHKEFQDYARENLVMLKLDFPRRTAQPPELAQANQALAQKFGIRGFPTILLLDEGGQELGRTGYQQMNPLEYVQHLKQLLHSS